MLLRQTVLLSLCLSINAHELRRWHYGGGRGGANSGGGSVTSNAFTNSTEASGQNDASSSIAVDTTSTASGTTAAAAASSTTASALGSAVAATFGNSSIIAHQSTGGGNGGGKSGGDNGGNSGDNGATLLAGNIQPASGSDGGAAVEAGQSPSATDPDNFINFCTGKNTTDGFQVVTGSCNGVVMGDIPASTNMISSIITNPAPGDTLVANTNFTVNVQVSNLAAGTFTNPLTTYYSAPQALKDGLIIGHTHITIQSLGNSLTASSPPDPQTFAFFKGINDAGNGEGALSAAVAGGLPAGAYRVCTLTSAANHQPVLMPVAQRGAQDDCTKFLVTDSGNAAAGGSSQSTPATSAGSSATTASSSSSSSSSSNTAGQSNSGSFHKHHGVRYSKRAFIA